MNEERFIQSSKEGIKYKLSDKAKNSKPSGVVAVLKKYNIEVLDYIKAKNKLKKNELDILSVIKLGTEFSYVLYITEMCKMLNSRGLLDSKLYHMLEVDINNLK